ncbi:MAG TPA: glycosyltransferase family 2 protein [Patescibacteria group bacterium]|nr:glycosyltransferase family 2 protein [Patescibacteria group bacterium]
MRKLTLSVIIIALNEEKNIEQCLRSVSWADEIVVVVDDRTTDGTVEISQKYTENVYQRRFDGYGKQKQFALTHTTGEWVLNLDADERVTGELRREIEEKIQRKEYDGYHLYFQEVYLGKPLVFRKIGGSERLFKRGKGTFTDADIHERVRVQGRIGLISIPIQHHSAPTVTKIVEKFNHYTTLDAKALRDAGATFSYMKLFLSPPYTFFERFILHRGYEDGFRGFIYAAFAAFYHFLKHLKMWELERNDVSVSSKR